ncbi:MAG: hypothetical protein IPK44_03445 [Candidatus Accumulibacter sp.]|uniref:hypothetical protein n=1 Tax=Accumulibacter sp. TaxID=2053492 RepID=UPI0025838817|nr:hypothetical protein [Accumulibacter sp.]MBK8113651.1 hypothetical protein [Accumulibacter sp.]
MLDLSHVRKQGHEVQTRHPHSAMLAAKKSWQAIQAIDEIVANAIELSSVEADYISGYDIKYRIGQGNNDA